MNEVINGLIDENFAADAVILGDGDYPTHPIPVGILQRANFLCCCDGAGKHLISLGGHPDAIVGDGDSLPSSFKEQHRDIIHIFHEQDDNDLTKSTKYCIQCGAKTIVYLGATGKREDHTLGNLSLMVRYMHEFSVCPVLVTDYGCFVPAQGRSTFAAFPRQQVSIFNFGCTRLHSDGLHWPASPFTSWWQGTLNESLADRFTLDGDGAYLVFRTFDAKP